MDCAARGSKQPAILPTAFMEMETDMMMGENHKLQQTIQRYFDGLYRSDIQLLEQVFHPSAVISGYGRDGKFVAMGRDDFLKFVDGVPAPADQGVEFDMEVLSIDVTGSIAAVKVRDFYLGKDFTDYLHLLDTGEEWRIIGKAFHADARQ